MQEYIDTSEHDGEYCGIKIDFASLLWQQLNRILKAGSYGANKIYVSSVLELHQVLAPHHSQKYLALIDKLQVQCAETLARYPPAQREKVRPELERKLAFVMFGELNKLMTIKGLLPEKAIN